MQQPTGSDQNRTTTFFTAGTAFAPPDQVNKGLDRAARLFNLYGAAKLGATDVNIVLVLHSEATQSIKGEFYQPRFAAYQNANRELQQAGSRVLACGQALNLLDFHVQDS